MEPLHVGGPLYHGLQECRRGGEHVRRLVQVEGTPGIGASQPLGQDVVFVVGDKVLSSLADLGEVDRTDELVVRIHQLQGRRMAEESPHLQSVHADQSSQLLTHLRVLQVLPVVVGGLRLEDAEIRLLAAGSQENCPRQARLPGVVGHQAVDENDHRPTSAAPRTSSNCWSGGISLSLFSDRRDQKIPVGFGW